MANEVDSIKCRFPDYCARNQQIHGDLVFAEASHNPAASFTEKNGFHHLMSRRDCCKGKCYAKKLYNLINFRALVPQQFIIQLRC